MNVQDAYNEWSQTYDADDNATRDLDQSVLARVLGGTRFKSIIEAGCGTGKNTPLLAGIGGRVTALDFSPGMIAREGEIGRARQRDIFPGGHHGTLALR